MSYNNQYSIVNTNEMEETMKKKTVFDKIHEYIIHNKEHLEHISSTKIAQDLDVSQASVIKYVKKMGYKGFSDFKISTIKELENKFMISPIIHNQVSVSDNEDIIIKKICADEMNSLNETREGIDVSTLKEIINLLNKKSKIMVIGIGSSGIVAQDLVYKLIKIGKLAFYYEEPHKQLMQLSSFDKNDLVIAISHSGETSSILNFVEKSKSKNISIFSITSGSENSLAKMSDYYLTTKSEENSLRSSAMSSRISQLFLIDVLFINLIKKNFSASMKKINKSRELVQWKM